MTTVQWIFDLLNDYSSAINAIATVVVALLTLFLASDNRKLRQAGTEPEVVVYFAPHRDGRGGINFVVSNIGQGPALSVAFKMECDEEDFSQHKVLLRNDVGRSNISVLPQGEKIGSLFGIGHELFGGGDKGNGIPLKPFSVRVSYKNVRGKRISTTQTLDIKQFSGLSGLLTKPADREIARGIAKIEGHLSKIANRSATFVELLDASEIGDKVRRKIKAADSDGGGT